MNNQSYPVAIQSLIHSINLHGNNLIGIEVGVWKGASTYCMLENCPTIKELHAIDKFEPFVDHIESAEENVGAWYCDEREIEIAEFLFHHNMKYCKNNDKLTFYKGNSDDLVNNFANEYFDFVFLDAYLSEEDVYKDLTLWYPKLKTGGLFMGDDIDDPKVEKTVINWRLQENIESHISIFDGTFVWAK